LRLAEFQFLLKWWRFLVTVQTERRWYHWLFVTISGSCRFFPQRRSWYINARNNRFSPPSLIFIKKKRVRALSIFAETTKSKKPFYIPSDFFHGADNDDCWDNDNQ
jgi:hypothetical protein